MKLKLIVTSIAMVISVAAQQQPEPPREWIDPDTGHRVIRLSNEPGSASLYFHQNPYAPDGRKLLITVASRIWTQTAEPTAEHAENWAE